MGILVVLDNQQHPQEVKLHPEGIQVMVVQVGLPAMMVSPHSDKYQTELFLFHKEQLPSVRREFM
jgi:hypothetical protein